MAVSFLDFEQPIAELEAKIEELGHVTSDSEVNIEEEIARLHAKSRALTKSIFSNLTPWQITQLARHPQRPYTLDYVAAICTDFHELHGDRMYADDLAIVGGVARLDGQPVMVIGHQKGRDTKERVRRNYGMPKPEGYRKALRLMKMAERFGLPIITFIDTQGVSGSRFRGARPERGHRPQSLRDVQSADPHHQCRDRRGRFGRRARDRGLRPAADAAIQYLLGDHPGGLCFDPLEER
jgi:acetyl-CoA carboxylase carboxyl transferase alpha subunit